MFKVAVCGCGVVGSGVADILIEQKDKLSARFNTEVCLGYILDIRDFTGTPYAPYMAKDVDTILADPDVKLFSVTIGGLDFAYQLCRKALEAGRHVVTSNKEVVAAYGRELEQMADDHNVRFLYEASAGGGMVTAKVTGKKQLVALTIKPEAVDPEDVELLQDMVLAAVNEAIKQADETVEREMGKLTGGLGMPGLF